MRTQAKGQVHGIQGLQPTAEKQAERRVGKEKEQRRATYPGTGIRSHVSYQTLKGGVRPFSVRALCLCSVPPVP